MHLIGFGGRIIDLIHMIRKFNTLQLWVSRRKFESSLCADASCTKVKRDRSGIEKRMQLAQNIYTRSKHESQ